MSFKVNQIVLVTGQDCDRNTYKEALGVVLAPATLCIMFDNAVYVKLVAASIHDPSSICKYCHFEASSLTALSKKDPPPLPPSNLFCPECGKRTLKLLGKNPSHPEGTVWQCSCSKKVITIHPPRPTTSSVKERITDYPI